jgi:hypothetical protein
MSHYSATPEWKERIEAAAERMGRPAVLIDSEGYRCEIIGAAVSCSGEVAYIETRVKHKSHSVDVSIKIHLYGHDDAAVDIETHNPYFGCDVKFFEWIGDENETAMLIYREKKRTYACSFQRPPNQKEQEMNGQHSVIGWPPKFVEIGHRWCIEGDKLTYTKQYTKIVLRLSLPDLDPIDLPPKEEATTNHNDNEEDYIGNAIDLFHFNSDESTGSEMEDKEEEEVADERYLEPIFDNAEGTAAVSSRVLTNGSYSAGNLVASTTTESSSNKAELDESIEQETQKEP